MGKREDIGSNISALGNVVLSAKNINGKAVHLSSQQGNVALLADKDITLENGEKYFEMDQASYIKSKGSLGSSSMTTKINIVSDQSVANQLDARGNVVLRSDQGSINATHLVADAGNNIHITAKQGDVNLRSAINTETLSINTASKSTIKYSNSQQGYIDEEVAQSTLKAGNSIDINAGKNIELQANDIQAENTIYIGNTLMQRQADGALKAADGSLMPENVTLSTLETHDQQWSERQSGYRGIAKELIKTVAIGMKGLEGLAPGLKIDSKLTVGESSSKRTEQVNQTGSSLTGSNVSIGSSGQTILTSADIAAQNTVISGQKVTLNAAEEQNITAEFQSKETIEGLGVKLNKDNIRLGGFVSEDATQSNKTRETTHKAGSIQTNNLNIQAADGVDILGQNITSTGETVIDHGRGTLNIGGYENKTEIEEKSHTETISTEVGVRNAYLDAALAVVAVKDAAKALSDAKDAYSQAQRDHAAGKMTKEALDDSKANVAMATANLATAQIAVGTAAATAAASTATYGFTIGANGERIETTTTTNTLQGEWQGSNLNLNNLILKSENQDINIQGSRVSATGTTTFDGTKDLNIIAGTEHRSQDSSSKTNSQSVSYTYGGGGSASIGKQTSKSQSESLTHVNSQVELNQTAGSINKLNIQGGEVSIADRGSLKVNEIHVESLQDTATSSNSSKGGNIGAGFGSDGKASNISAGYNQSKGSSDSAWVNNTSKLLIGNAQNDADLDAMGVKNITNIGGVIANATKNSDGTLTDHGKLNYSSELELKDIQDHNYSSGSGFNVSTSIGIPQKGTKEASIHPKGSTTIGLNSSGQETEQLTKATMGQGTVNTTADTNRDINNTQEITRDQTTGMLDGSVTIDHRLLTESGRAEIIQQQKDLPENFRQSAENLAMFLPDGVYRDRALQTLNNIQAQLYDLPEQFKEAGKLGNDVAIELIKKGVEPDQISKLFGDSGFINSTYFLNKINDKFEALADQGLSLEQILNAKASDASISIILAKGKSLETEVTYSDRLGMTILNNIGKLGNELQDISKVTGVDPETVQLAIGLLFAGPIKLTGQLLNSMIVDNVIGDYIAKGKDNIANSLTASAHNTNSSLIAEWTDPKSLKEIQSSGIDDDIDFAEQLALNKQGAEYLINAAAGIIGVGVGKGITKEKDSEFEINKKQSLDVGWVDNYGNQKKVTGDGTVDRDHQPSKAALIRRATELKGSPLTMDEKNRIINEGMSVTVPKEVHASGPTYKGRNTKELIEKDANDLQAAQIRDSNAMIENAKKITPDYVEKLQEACTTLSCKTNADYDKFLQSILDSGVRKNDR